MKILLVRRPLIAVLLCTALLACNQGPQGTPAAPPQGAADAAASATDKVESPPPAPPEAAKDVRDIPAAAAIDPATQLTSSAATYTDARRKFIRTAQAQFRVRDVYASALAIEDIASAQGGFVIDNDIHTQTLDTRTRPRGDGKLIELVEYNLQGHLVVRVPSDHTQAFLRAIAGQMDFLDQRHFQATDAQFDVLRQQLAWQRAQEAQQELAQAAQQGGKLNQKMDVASARSDAKAARDEALIAQKQFEDRIDFSTIELSLYQTPRVRATEWVDVEAEFQRNGPGFFPRLAASLRDGWTGLLDVVVALAAAWPFWLTVVAIAVAFVSRRRSKRNASVGTSANSE